MKELKKFKSYTLYQTDKGQKVISYRNDIFGIQNGAIICFTDLMQKVKPDLEKEFLNLLGGQQETEQEQEQKEKAEQEQEEGQEQEQEPEQEKEEQKEQEQEQQEQEQEEQEQEQEEEQKEETEQEQEQKEIKSPVYDEVLTYVNNNMPVYLFGPAGTGKSYLAREIAKDLNLDFYFTNCVKQEFKLTGFVDAHGKFHETALYKAMKFGGVFFLDELDGSDPNALINLNSILADGYFQFPNGEFIEANKDFRIVAAGNTAGEGANESYNGRYKLDASSLNRFKKVAVDYDKRIEALITNNNQELMTFADYIRQQAKESFLPLIISYRDLKDIVKLEKVLGTEKMLKSTIFYNTSVDTINNLVYSWEGGKNKYIKALKKIA